jgi:hypothetical protein
VFPQNYAIESGGTRGGTLFFNPDDLHKFQGVKPKPLKTLILLTLSAKTELFEFIFILSRMVLTRPQRKKQPLDIQGVLFFQMGL